MKKLFPASLKRLAKQSMVSVLCWLLPLTLGPTLYAQQGSAQQAAPIPSKELDALVAPIALYPDELLGQILVASTYPLEIVELAQWLQQKSDMQGQALVQAVKQQNWDPSVQALVTFPDLVKQLSGNIKWTTQLGNAFLAQQSDVMNAIQSMRAQAMNAGKLQSNQQQTVSTEAAGDKTVVVIQPADPEVVYVPSYDPDYIWGAGAYPYPPISYPYGAGLLSFGAGAAIGALWGHGGWGWGCGWGNNDINVNNNFMRNNNLNRTNIANNRGTGVWQHNPQHRGGTPYPNSQLANRFGGSTREGLAGQRDNLNRPGMGGDLNRQGLGSNLQRPGGMDAANRMGDRQISSPSGFGDRGAFGGLDRGGGFAGASSDRGRSSMGGFGGHSFGGGGFGGFRGGGGRRR